MAQPNPTYDDSSLWATCGVGHPNLNGRRIDEEDQMKEGLLLIALAIAAVLAFAAIGGDGGDLEQHARWMADVRDSGTAVMW